MTSLSKEVYLAYQLAIHNVRARYKNSALGFMWSFAYPCILFATYYLAFRVVIKTPFTDEGTVTFAFSIFYWYWFAQCLGEAPSILLNNKHLIAKVPIKLKTLVLSAVLSQTIHFSITILTLVLISAAGFGLFPNIPLMFLSVLLTSIFFLGLYPFLGILNVFFRDVQHLVSNLTTPLFFFTPVVYDFEKLSSDIQTVLLFNPASSLMLCFKSSVQHSDHLTTYLLLASVWLLVIVFFSQLAQKKLLKQVLDRL